MKKYILIILFSFTILLMRCGNKSESIEPEVIAPPVTSITTEINEDTVPKSIYDELKKEYDAINSENQYNINKISELKADIATLILSIQEKKLN